MFTVEDHGSIVLVRPLTADVSEWLTDHTDPDNSTWFGGALVVEPRYLGDLVEGMVAEGYALQ